MSPAEKHLLSVCDELMTCISKARCLDALDREKSSALIDRVLDVRNQISPPKTKPQTTTLKP